MSIPAHSTRVSMHTSMCNDPLLSPTHLEVPILIRAAVAVWKCFCCFPGAAWGCCGGCTPPPPKCLCLAHGCCQEVAFLPALFLILKLSQN